MYALRLGLYANRVRSAYGRLSFWSPHFGHDIPRIQRPERRVWKPTKTFHSPPDSPLPRCKRVRSSHPTARKR